jgi:hypothetical protein
MHGLHPDEAADIALSALDAAAGDAGAAAARAAAPGATTWCAFIVGTRHHSRKLGKGGGSLAAALHAALDDAGVPFHSAGELGGITCVRI